MNYSNKIYTRKEISNQLDIGKETLRYYEKIKLIPKPLRNANGYRLYTEEDVLRIRFVVTMKQYGFKLSEISSIIERVSNDKKIDRSKLVKFLDTKIKSLENHKYELEKQIDILKKVKSNSHLGECEFLNSIIQEDKENNH